jgi:hypothetical protein
MRIRIFILLVFFVPVNFLNANSTRRISIESRDLEMILDIVNITSHGQGIKLTSLIDKQTKTSLTSKESSPIFTLEIRNLATKKIIFINADEGWEKAYCQTIDILIYYPYWSATQSIDNGIWYIDFRTGVTDYNTMSNYGYSFRCVRDVK